MNTETKEQEIARLKARIAELERSRLNDRCNAFKRLENSFRQMQSGSYGFSYESGRPIVEKLDFIKFYPFTLVAKNHAERLLSDPNLVADFKTFYNIEG